MNQTAGERWKNVKKITKSVIAAFALFTVPLWATERHRAARPPVSDSTPAGWLANHAYRSIEAIGTVSGSATVIGLGDDTHGTHEFWQTKLQMIEKLVRDNGVTVIGFEGPFADFNKLDDYVQGGAEDPRTVLRHHELGYWFWASEEIVAALDWIRSYNATRGDRPAIEVFGFDVTDPQGASDIVTSYLDAADASAAASARAAYSGCFNAAPPADCPSRIAGVLAGLDAREAELVAKSSQHAFDIAEHAAHVAAVGYGESLATDANYYAWRDQNMAANALALQSNRKMILWAHNEHVGKTQNIEGSKPMGQWIEEAIGANYFVLGTCTGEGLFNVVKTPPYVTVVLDTIDTPTMFDYESSFRSARIPLMLIPLQGPLPDWLSTTRTLRGGTSGSAYVRTETLPAKFDAILYIDITTPATSFW